MGGLLVFIIFLAYAWIGNKLKRNSIVWGLRGVGTMMIFPVIGIVFILFVKDPEAKLLYWTGVCAASFLITLGIALRIAIRNKLLFGKSIA